MTKLKLEKGFTVMSDKKAKEKTEKKVKENTVVLYRLQRLIDGEQSRQTIADKIGCNVSLITKHYNGNKIVTIDSLKKYAEYFNVSTDYLLGLSEAKTTDKDLQFICDYTGLNENIITYFHNQLTYENRFILTYKAMSEANLLDEEYTPQTFIEHYGEISYNETKEEIEEEIKGIKKYYNDLLSSDFLEKVRSYSGRISVLSEDISLFLAVLFNDNAFLKKTLFCNSYFKNKNSDDLIISVIEYLHDYFSEATDYLKDDYFLNLFKCQQAMTTYIQNSYTMLDYFANYKNERFNTQGKLTYFVGAAIDKALKSDNVIETLHNEIQKLWEENIFTESEIEFFKKLFAEVKNNEQKTGKR